MRAATTSGTLTNRPGAPVTLENPAKLLDAVVVGGGPAGLSAALVLARCRRQTLVCDAGHPRNERSKAIHGMLSRDGTPPGEFLDVCRDQLLRYPGVEFLPIPVQRVARHGDQFALTLLDGTNLSSRAVLLATGIVDDLPDIPGLMDFYGRSVHHCPFCDGWEHRDESIAVYGQGVAAAELALELLSWSKRLVLCCGGPSRLSSAQAAFLERREITVDERAIVRLLGHGDQLEAICFESGEPLPCSALFFSPGQSQRSALAAELGCEFCDDATVRCAESGETCIPGLFAAGNASQGMQLVIIAAAEGARSAFSLHHYLSAADLALPA